MLQYLRELPLVLFLVGAVFASILFYLLRRLPPGHKSTLLRGVAVGSGILTLSIFIVLNLISIRGHMLYPDEANILSIAATGLHGQPVYHPVAAPDLCYSLMYDPDTFLIYQALFLIGGGRFWVLKTAVVLANLLTSCILFSLLRKFIPRQAALSLIAFPLCALLLNVYSSFSLRSATWIVLAMSLATRFAFIESELPAAILTGVSAGIPIRPKTTLPPAFLLPPPLLSRP